jgi:hypothetical protein
MKTERSLCIELQHIRHDVEPETETPNASQKKVNADVTDEFVDRHFAVVQISSIVSALSSKGVAAFLSPLRDSSLRSWTP